MAGLDRKAVVELLRQSGVDFESGSRTAEEIVDGLFDKGRRSADRDVLEGAVRFVEALITSAGPPESTLPQLRQLVGSHELALDPIEELEDISRILTGSGVDPSNIEIDLGLGRGLRYYTGMLFEIYDTRERLQIAGGGRYDDLARQLGARNPVQSAGFSIGLERLLDAGRSTTSTINDSRILVLNTSDPAATFELAANLRSAGWTAIIDSRDRSISAARRWATRNGFVATASQSDETTLYSRCADGKEIQSTAVLEPARVVSA